MPTKLAKFPEPPLNQEDALERVRPPRPLSMRQEIESVFKSLDGAAGMTAWVNESTANKRLFYTQILPRIIPRETAITGADGGAVQLEMLHGVNLKALSDRELEVWIELTRKTATVDIEYATVVESTDS